MLPENKNWLARRLRFVKGRIGLGSTLVGRRWLFAAKAIYSITLAA
jgi:hypothetical protein